MSVATLANKTVVVERRTYNYDLAGGRTYSWELVATVKARVQPLSSSEALRHSSDDSRVSHKVYVPGNPDITAGDRLIVDDYVLHVTGVRDIDLVGRFVTIEAYDPEMYEVPS